MSNFNAKIGLNHIRFTHLVGGGNWQCHMLSVCSYILCGLVDTVGCSCGLEYSFNFAVLWSQCR